MDLFSAFGTLVKVADTGSFSAAARLLNTSQATISRQIAFLEDHFGTRLFHRTTRQLTLTEDGQGLLDHARRVSEELVAAEAAIGRQRADPRGRVHMAVPTAFGMALTQELPKLHQRYPGISVALTLQDSTPNLIESGLDLAIRVGAAQEAPVISRTIGNVERIAVAAPHYLATMPGLNTPADLSRHHCIEYYYGTLEAGWEFVGEDGPVNMPVAGWLSTSSSIAARQAVLAGAGIAVLPVFMVAADLQSGALTQVLRNFPLTTVPTHIAFPSRHNMPARTRAVIEFVVEVFSTATGCLPA